MTAARVFSIRPDCCLDRNARQHRAARVADDAAERALRADHRRRQYNVAATKLLIINALTFATPCMASPSSWLDQTVERVASRVSALNPSHANTGPFPVNEFHRFPGAIGGSGRSICLVARATMNTAVSRRKAPTGTEGCPDRGRRHSRRPPGEEPARQEHAGGNQAARHQAVAAGRRRQGGRLTANRMCTSERPTPWACARVHMSRRVSFDTSTYRGALKPCNVSSSAAPAPRRRTSDHQPNCKCNRG